MESWKPKIINYNNIQKPSGRFKPNAPCKKHPKHRQSPGVCSICLSERLSRLNNTNGSSRQIKAVKYLSSSSSSYLSSLSSSDGSSCSSPVRGRPMDSELSRKSMRVFKTNNGGHDHVLKKSRSMAVVFLGRRKEDMNREKGGFWSKLLPRKNKGLMHETTMRERVVNNTTTVH